MNVDTWTDYYCVCTNCGERTDDYDSEDEAAESAKEDGWVYYPEHHVQLCPSCIAKGVDPATL